MLAQFDSACPLCPYPIERGQSLLQDDEARWAHAGCVARVERRSAAETVCQGCFIVHPCECDT